MQHVYCKCIIREMNLLWIVVNYRSIRKKDQRRGLVGTYRVYLLKSNTNNFPYKMN
jgi:hypothetical protein